MPAFALATEPDIQSRASGNGWVTTAIVKNGVSYVLNGGIGLDSSHRATTGLHKIVLISTHVVPDVEYVSKEILLLSNGVLLRQGSTQELVREIRGQVWEVVVPGDQVKDMGRYGLVCSMARAEENVVVRFLSATRPEELCCTEAEPTLEDVYLHHFGDAEGL